jgi:hypothetical protein
LGLVLVLLFVLAALVLRVVRLALVLGFVGLGRPAVGVSANAILPVPGCFPILEEFRGPTKRFAVIWRLSKAGARFGCFFFS